MNKFAHINLDNLTHNLNIFKSVSKAEVFAVVKANAYGHGDKEVSKLLDKQGVLVLCVSSIEEALNIVEDVTADILIFGYTDIESIEKYHHPQFIYTAGSLNWINQLESLSTQVRLHIEVNTGMNRFGFKEKVDLQSALDTKHHIEGIYTHFTSSESDERVTLKQVENFKSIVHDLDYNFKYVHAGNTHGAFKNDPLFNAVRIGIGLYGWSVKDIGLKPVMSLYTQVVHVDVLHEGESVGYNQTYTTDKETYFATIPVGYADGFDVRNHGLDVYIENQSYPIIGKVCMDQSMIEVDGHIKVGDVVELIGPNRTVGTISKHLNVIPYIIYTSVGARVKRLYK